MNKNRIGICMILALAALATSCVDMIGPVDIAPKINREHIVFGGGTIEDVTITRSGESDAEGCTERVLESESSGVSLPLFVSVEQGIRRATPATRAAITTEIATITNLDAWGTKNTYTDANKTQVTNRELFFFGSDGKAETGALFTKEAGNEDINGDGTIDDIFYPDGNGPYLWEKTTSAVSDFNFVTVSPAGCGFKAVINPTNYTVTFDYEVPAAATDQKDILVAVPDPVPVNYGRPVPLDYKHVMAAVNVKVGEKMPAGVIKSIQFKGVYDKASYYPTTNEWTNRSFKENGGVFNVTLPAGGLPVGPESAGTGITTAETSFMMIPQQLFTGAEIVVEFHDNNTNKDVTLRASIQGDVWERNTTTNYLLNIDPNYNISIVPLDKTIDSHYVITKVEISCEYPVWVLSATSNDGADISVELEENLNPMAKLGFWTDKISTSKDSNGNYILSSESARGSSYTYGTQTSSQIISVFIPENISGATREVTLTLMGGQAIDKLESTKTLVLTQNSIKWLQDPYNTGDNDTYWGCEILIENGIVPWGFNFEDLNEDWRAYGKVTNQPPGWIDKIVAAMKAAGLNVDDLYSEDSPIRIIERGDHQSTFLIRIDYGKLGQIDIAEDGLNGHKNTFDLYHFEGINVIASIKDFLIQSAQAGNKGVEHVPGTFNGDLDKTLDFAAMYAMKRNRFHLYTEVIDGDGGAATMSIPIIMDADINWYLPAKDQFPCFLNTNWGQAFSFNDLFWTSTAAHIDENDNLHAYAYLNGIETIALRESTYLTFALRRYSTSTGVQIPINPEDVVRPGDDNGSFGEGGGNGDDNTGGDIVGP